MVRTVCYGHFGFVVFSVSASCGLEWFEGCAMATLVLFYSLSLSPVGLNGLKGAFW